MRVVDHRLCHEDGSPYPYRNSPNVGGGLNPQYLVMHYTAGRSAEQSISWFTRSQARASAHLVIGRDGSITQMVPFNRVAWHAGKSQWQSLSGMNQYSIGIELDNAGTLTRSSDGLWRAWFGDPYEQRDVIEAVHKNDTQMRAWHLYTPQQLFAALEVSNLIVQEYQLKDILGHDDVSPGRKTDPGPAFPMETFRSRLFGREDDVEGESLYCTTELLNIRIGPGTEYEKLPVSPLPKETKLEIISSRGRWREVEVIDEVNGEMDIVGWVHGRYITRC